MYTFLFWMEHFGIWNRCILGFVKLVQIALLRSSFRPSRNNFSFLVAGDIFQENCHNFAWFNSMWRVQHVKLSSGRYVWESDPRQWSTLLQGSIIDVTGHKPTTQPCYNESLMTPGDWVLIRPVHFCCDFCQARWFVDITLGPFY